MSKSAKYWAALAAVALLQIGFLAKMAFDRVSLIKSGREIALQVIPILLMNTCVSVLMASGVMHLLSGRS